MNHDYHDITGRIPESPRWWDEHAVPRYSDFSPREVANIYAIEAVLVEIECQGCGQRFNVAWSRGASRIGWDENDRAYVKRTKPFDPQQFHYGDPPNAGCCAAGPTMNSIPRRVLEVWRQNERFGWERDPQREVPIACEWAPTGDTKK